jgi:hypothetical protein
VALQDYNQQVGAPNEIKTDNAQRELGSTWTKVLSDVCTSSETTEPNQQWQNPAERKIGALVSMVRNVMRAFNAPLSRHDYAQKWCCEVLNVVANRKVGWRTPLEQNFVFISGSLFGTMYDLSNQKIIFTTRK